MKTRKITRYYCDHCHKGGFRRPDMERHEGVCFQNPHRNCPECEQQSTDVRSNMEFLFKHGLQALKEHLACPACVISAVIQYNAGATGGEFITYDTYKEDITDYRNEKFASKQAYE